MVSSSIVTFNCESYNTNMIPFVKMLECVETPNIICMINKIKYNNYSENSTIICYKKIVNDKNHISYGHMITMSNCARYINSDKYTTFYECTQDTFTNRYNIVSKNFVTKYFIDWQTFAYVISFLMIQLVFGIGSLICWCCNGGWSSLKSMMYRLYRKIRLLGSDNIEENIQLNTYNI